MKKTKTIVGITALAAVIVLITSCAMIGGLFKPEPTCAELGEHQWEKKGQKRYSFPIDANHQPIMNRHNEVCWKCGVEKPDSRAAHKGNPCSLCGYDSTPPSSNRPGPGDMHCFAAGTTILMADNTLKNIEAVKEGDWVQRYDFETSQLTVSQVTKLVSVLHTDLVRLTFANGSEIVTTTDHPFRIERTMWIAASSPSFGRGVWAAVNAERANTLYHQTAEVAELKTGEKVFMPQYNGFVEMVGLETIPALQMTYTIELSQNDNFIANGMSVKTEEVR
jgi:hypothetical protein